ncbi:MAG: hypothetical protein A2Y25_12075 [Candidatus Melainabacteria bacterium GWF2_37_15]|nr:MAG: hypothetical protein A2Y25_12075 [Candidatus Melainabacteria bacterium GWF2_37_15]
MNINILFQNIGSIDEKLDCLYPVYLLYPEIPKYEFIYDEEYFTPLIKRHFREIEEFNAGDLLVFKLLNSFHFGIYAGNGNFFHCCKKHKLRISRLSGYKKYLKGCYKWHN